MPGSLPFRPAECLRLVRENDTVPPVMRVARDWKRGGVAVTPSVWHRVLNCQLYVIPVCKRMRWRSRSGQNGFAVIRWTRSCSLIGRERVAFTRSWEITKPLFIWTLVVILFWQMIHKWFAPGDFIKCSKFWISVAYLFICFFCCTRFIYF